MDIVKKEMSEVALYLWERRWAELNAGNISVNVTDIVREKSTDGKPYIKLHTSFPAIGNSIFQVTGTGTRMRDVARDFDNNTSLVQMDSKGEGYYIMNSENGVKPTSEFPSHLILQEHFIINSSPNKAVVHTHPNDIVAMSQMAKFQDSDVMTKTLWSMHPETYVFNPKGVAVAPYMLPGGFDIAVASLEAVVKSKTDVVVWAKHGVFAFADSALLAFDRIDVVAKAASIYIKVRSCGEEPLGLTDENFAEIKEAFNL